jgi:hypothetical protein
MTDVEIRCSLIQRECSRLLGQRASDSHPLPFPTRQRLYPPVGEVAYVTSVKCSLNSGIIGLTR